MSSLRVSGMFSGLDTDSIVQALVSAKTVKVDTLEKEQMLLELQQEKWQEVNSKIFDFYNSTLTTMRNSAAYTQTVTQSSDESVLNITSGTASTNGIQTAAVTQLAKAEYLTGAELKTAGSGSVSGSTKLSDLSSWGTDGFSDGTFYVQASKTAARVAITIDENTTMDDLTSQLSKAGVTASFDSENGRLFISSNSTGEANSFSFVDGDGKLLDDQDETGGYALLSGLGLTEEEGEGGATIVAGQDAKVLLNGAVFSSSTNAFAVNGLTFTVSGLSEKVGDVYNEVSISTETNYDGIYDSIKNMISEYNELVNELSSLYNSTSSSLMPLTSEEKMSMTDSDIELW
ncbi:MAG: flagellar filament capping protein FliD, partial [Eubacteriales bacterium]